MLSAPRRAPSTAPASIGPSACAEIGTPVASVMGGTTASAAIIAAKSAMYTMSLVVMADGLWGVTRGIVTRPPSFSKCVE